MFKSPAQRRAVMAYLREKGFLGKLAQRLKAGHPLVEKHAQNLLRRAGLGRQNVRDFEEMLSRRVDPRQAMENIRLGGVMPRFDRARAEKFYRMIDPKSPVPLPHLRYKDPGPAAAEWRQFISLKGMPPYPKDMMVTTRVFAVEGGPEFYRKNPLKTHVLLDKEVRARHSRKAVLSVDDMFAGWHGSASSPGSAWLRQTVREALLPIRPGRSVRPYIRRQLRREASEYPVEGVRAPGWRKLAALRSYSPEKFRPMSQEKAYVKDLHLANQAVLRRAFPGQDHITLYRGVKYDLAEKIKEDIRRHGVAVLPADTLSSWSESNSVARRFSDQAYAEAIAMHPSTRAALENRGVVIKAKMPIERSLVSWRTARTGGREREHIIMGDRFYLTAEDIVE